ncbi:hypothetical protein GIB67_031723 [Kingdonia uniflora]|uniref:Uncharacterized protein n=1 Tax=Kingdonia uniflora TaxID=39325 RepID=A0A7J7NKN7_9MAGN|nr:hypothetical protein GIB67_031723 [Kingdonia uniflora]
MENKFDVSDDSQEEECEKNNNDVLVGSEDEAAVHSEGKEKEDESEEERVKQNLGKPSSKDEDESEVEKEVGTQGKRSRKSSSKKEDESEEEDAGTRKQSSRKSSGKGKSMNLTTPMKAHPITLPKKLMQQIDVIRSYIAQVNIAARDAQVKGTYMRIQRFQKMDRKDAFQKMDGKTYHFTFQCKQTSSLDSNEESVLPLDQKINQHKLSPAEVKNKTVPSVVAAISKAIHDLRKEGAKNFLIIDIMALGCTPHVLARASKGPYNSTDQWGCLEDYNGIAYLFHKEGVGSSIAISFFVYETLRSSWRIRRGSCKYGECAKQKADDAYTPAKDTMSGKAETNYEAPKLYTMQLS